MGDRNNPIKFGPEWLRNLSREPSAGGSGPNNQNNPPWTTNTSGPLGPGPGPMMGQNYGTVANPTSGTSASQNSGSGVSAAAGQTGSSSPVAPYSSGGAGAAAGSGSPLPGPSSGGIPRNRTNNPVPKILLAKLRYGREEMLALYDRYLESPEELKHFDILYQPRAKPPFALNNTFDEDVRDNVRSGPPVGAIPIPERYSSSRGGIGRGSNISEARGRSRMPFVRQTILGGRGGNNSWHNMTNLRMPTYNTGPDEDATLRPWNINNGSNNQVKSGNEPPEWNPTKLFRRRQNNNTNWRQPHVRDENEEWRFPETQRNRPSADKWDRGEWGERPNQERQQSWNSNRRTWVGNETLNNEDNLPEWAVDNTEAGAGTFDSSGAFHGYSNDDTNLPKSQETPFPLARSQTHGSFSRSKTAEEGLDEWWASEKAKKSSGKKFDAADSKFVKAGSSGSVEGSNTNSKQNVGREDETYNEISEREEKIDPPESPEGEDSNGEDANQNNIFTNQFQESKAFEALMRSDIELDNTNNERSNFQSVMITPNHGLRQKHQNLVPCPVDSTGRQHLNTGLLQMLHVLPPMNPAPDNENRATPDDKLVEKILDMTLEDPKLQNPMMVPMHPNINPGMPNQMANNLQLQLGNQVLPNHGMPVKGASSLQMTNLQGQMQPMHNVGVPNQMNPPIQNVGMHNSALNSSLGLSIGTPNSNLVMPMQGVPPSVMPNPGIQARLGFQPSGRMPIMPGANVGNTSLFMGHNNPQLMPSNEIPMPNANPQNNMYPMHTLQHSQGSQGPFSSMYNLPQAATPITPDSNLVDAWYYEDPEKVIQGPFSSKEMYNWYRAGFFTPSLMVRRACEAHLRPLGSYGPVVPFIQIDMLPTYPMSTPYETHPQQGMGVDDSLWSQPAPSADMIWMQQMNNRNESRVNNLPMFFWDSQAASAISSNALLPEEIAKEMKTEDQILAQLRASQNLPAPQATPFINDQPPTSTANAPATFNKSEETFQTNVSATPNLEELQKLIQPEALSPPAAFSQPDPEPDKKAESQEIELSEVQETKEEPGPMEPSLPAPAPELAPKQQQPQRKVSPEPKLPKQAKNDGEKVVIKIKDNNNVKTKNKKAKEEKKEEVPETKTKADDVPVKAEKRSVESSPTKSKKEEKQNKKEQEKEKKELVKNGFTIVKGVDKTIKENKKKAEEAKALASAAEEVERKKKKEEETAVEEEKKRKIADAIKKAQDQQQQRQESIAKKAPWSSLTAQSVACNQEQGLTLAEIQRLEREKKVEQIKEQQQMMQMIAQQQAAAMARDQEKQAGLGWAKKKSSNVNVSGQKLADIQAETRKAAAAVAAAAATAAAAAAKALDECPPAAPAPAPSPAPVLTVPWASSQNGGFWETQTTVASKIDKASETTKPTDFNKSKKKVTLCTTKKDISPAVEFEAWCTNILTPWNSKIDVPTFIGFLKDIESPYEVKDYVKCYLGETKDSSDFARQFLERRSKLLRVGMVTPSDDLCSPALAINPRNTNLGDYQEIKGKGKKAKKNKMLKVDARILGFSVTASEDRINVGDIDTV